MDPETIEKGNKIIILKIKLNKLETLISIEKREKELSMYKQLKESINTKIESQIKNLNLKENEKINLIPIKKIDIGKIFSVYYKEHSRYYYAIINKVDFENQKIEIEFISNKEKFILPSCLIRKIKFLDRKKLVKGFKCGYIERKSGKIFPCEILDCDDKIYDIINLKTNERLTFENENFFIFYKFNDKDKNDKEFVIPRNLKIMPNDTEEKRLIKKKKIKKLKFQFKTKEKNEFFRNKKNNWKEFQKKRKDKFLYNKLKKRR